MKRLLKVFIWGAIIWAVTLPWLDFNRVLMSPVFLGLLVGVGPAYLLGQRLGQRRRRAHTRPVRLSAVPTRPMVIGQRGDHSAGPTRPSPGIPARERASQPTHPMSVLAR